MARKIDAAAGIRQSDDYMAQALGWRQGASTGWFGIVSDEDARELGGPRSDPVEVNRWVAQSTISEIAEGIAGDGGPTRRGRPALPRDRHRHHDTARPAPWRLPPRARPLTARKYEADIRFMLDWLKGRGIETVQELTADAVGKFVSERLAGGEHRPTLNRRLTAPSAYWRWVQRRGLPPRETNPWSDQRVAARKKKRRAYMSDEMRTLLSGQPGALLDDAMRTLALSDMRVSELSRLTVADVRDGWFRIAENWAGNRSRRRGASQSIAPSPRSSAGAPPGGRPTLT